MSAVKPRAPRGSKKIPVAEKARKVLVHVRYLEEDQVYGLMLYSKLHHWADELSELMLCWCSWGLFSKIDHVPDSGMVLSITIAERIISSRSKGPRGVDFIDQADISGVDVHEINSNDPYLICLIDQLPEAVPTKPIAIKQEEELLDLPF